MRRIDYRGIEDDPLDSLVSARPEAVLAWMERKAALADGTQTWYPLVPGDWVAKAVDAARDDLLRTVNDYHTASHDAATVAKVGLLVSIAALRHDEIAILAGVPYGSITRIVRRHDERMADQTYALAIARVVSSALARFGDHVSPAQSAVIAR